MDDATRDDADPLPDATPGQPPDRPPARTLLLRIWRERSDGPDPVLRGTLSDLSGRPLGAFASVAALGALLVRLLSRPGR